MTIGVDMALGKANGARMRLAPSVFDPDDNDEDSWRRCPRQVIVVLSEQL